MTDRYSYIWEYEVPPEAEAEFLTRYAPDGSWVRLFRRAPGYIGTDLYRDRDRPERFVTVDHWRSEAAFREFRERFAAEFEALDRECARLTRREAALGRLRPVASPIEHYERGGFTVSTDPARLDVAAIHRFLSTSYWAQGIPLDRVRRSLEGSLCFGLYGPEGQVGLARVITDGATFAYLCDVYVLPEHQGQGLGRWLMECVMGSPRLQGLRRWMLVTRDAHRLYRPLGFATPSNPSGIMEIVRPGIYLTGDAGS